LKDGNALLDFLKFNRPAKAMEHGHQLFPLARRQ
jgi:hypothetical protein